MPKSVARRAVRRGGADGARRTSPALDALVRLIENTGAAASSAAAFGAPVTSGATTVVPVARVSVLTTMGGGSSTLPIGDGAGGAGLTRIRPAGYLVLDGTGASFRPIRQPASALALPLALIAAVAATRIVGVSVREARRRRRIAAREAAHRRSGATAAEGPGHGSAAEDDRAQHGDHKG